MIVKICGITRREDAEFAVEAGASALGFVFVSSSPRCVTPERAAELGSGLSILKVGVFVNETAASIAAVMRSAKLDIAQMYGGSAPDGARVWKAFRLTARLDPAMAEGAEAILLDGPANGIGFDWSLLRNSNPKISAAKIVVAGGSILPMWRTQSEQQSPGASTPALALKNIRASRITKKFASS